MEPIIAKQAVLAASSKIDDKTPIVGGYDWNKGIDYDSLLGSYITSGFQATNFGKAIQEIEKMVRYSAFLIFPFLQPVTFFCS